MLNAYSSKFFVGLFSICAITIAMPLTACDAETQDAECEGHAVGELFTVPWDDCNFHSCDADGRMWSTMMSCSKCPTGPVDCTRPELVDPSAAWVCAPDYSPDTCPGAVVKASDDGGASNVDGQASPDTGEAGTKEPDASVPPYR